MSERLVTLVTYWPEGCDPEGYDARHFRVTVDWAGKRTDGPRPVGGYRVTNNGSELSRAGKWTWMPMRFQRWQHRWETLDEACEWAEKVVDNVTVNGRTWAEWQAFHAARREASP